MLHDLPDGHGARGVGELAQLVELGGPVGALRVHADEERALRLRPWCGIGLARSHREIMPRYAPPVTALADRLAARTLELVNIPSQSGSEEAIRERLLELVPDGWTAEFAGDEAFLFAPPRRPGAAARSCSRPTTTPSRRRTTFPGASRTAPCTGSERAT